MKIYYLLSVFLFSGCTAMMSPWAYGGMEYSYNNAYPATEYSPSEQAYNYSAPQYPPTDYEYRAQQGSNNYEFQRFLSYLSTQTRGRDREKTLRLFVRHSSLTCQQAASILRLTPLEKERLDLLRILAPAIVDPQNSHLILNAYEFSSGRNDAQRILEDAHRPRTSENIARPFLNPRLQFPMDDNDFAAFARSLEEATFDSDKVNLIKSAIQHNFFTCEQVGKILSFLLFRQRAHQAIPPPRAPHHQSSKQLHPLLGFHLQ